MIHVVCYVTLLHVTVSFFTVLHEQFVTTFINLVICKAVWFTPLSVTYLCCHYKVYSHHAASGRNTAGSH